MDQLRMPTQSYWPCSSEGIEVLPVCSPFFIGLHSPCTKPFPFGQKVSQRGGVLLGFDLAGRWPAQAPPFLSILLGTPPQKKEGKKTGLLKPNHHSASLIIGGLDWWFGGLAQEGFPIDPTPQATHPNQRAVSKARARQVPKHNRQTDLNSAGFGQVSASVLSDFCRVGTRFWCVAGWY